METGTVNEDGECASGASKLQNPEFTLLCQAQGKQEHDQAHTHSAVPGPGYSLVNVSVVDLVDSHNVTVSTKKRQQAQQRPRGQCPVDGMGVLYERLGNHSPAAFVTEYTQALVYSSCQCQIAILGPACVLS